MTGSCGREPCPRHGWGCCYHGDEPDRCPRCHASWTVIERDEWHSCEKASSWGNGRDPDNAETIRQGIKWARTLREEAAQRPYEARPSEFCPHTSA